MAFERNLGRAARAAYVLTGVAFLAVGFLVTSPQWVRIILPLVGALVVVEGLIGF